jgi:hypothetical protein
MNDQGIINIHAVGGKRRVLCVSVWSQGSGLAVRMTTMNGGGFSLERQRR